MVLYYFGRGDFLLYFKKLIWLSDMFSVKRQLRDYLKMQERDHSRDDEFAEETGLLSPSGRVVLTAVVM